MPWLTSKLWAVFFCIVILLFFGGHSGIGLGHHSAYPAPHHVFYVRARGHFVPVEGIPNRILLPIIRMSDPCQHR